MTNKQYLDDLNEALRNCGTGIVRGNDMNWTDWHAKPPSGRKGERRQIPGRLPVADYALIQREAARRDVTMGELMLLWISPELEKLRCRSDTAGFLPMLKPP